MRATYIKLIALLMMAASLQNCADDEDVETRMEEVQFTFGVGQALNSGGRIADIEIPAGSSLLVSLQKGNGEAVFTSREIKLLNLDGSYITEPVQLKPGYYRIVDFMIIDEGNEILYATPRSGSSLASIVSTPLPVGFNVSKNKVSHVNMQVLATGQQRPEDFGYATFSVDVISMIQVAVFTPEDNQMNLSSAKAYILQSGDSIASFSLQAKVNLLSFSGDPAEDYTIVVIKDGFGRYEQTFNVSDFVSSALNISLQPAFSANIKPIISEFAGSSFTLLASQAGGSVRVDWGDGIVEEVVFQANGNEFHANAEHYYALSKDYYISVTGDLDHIIGLMHPFTSDERLYDLNFSQLSELQTVNMPYNAIKVLDLAQNFKLRNVYGPDTYVLEDIILPSSHDIAFIAATSPSFTTETIGQIINNIYNNVASRNIRNGEFDLASLMVEDPTFPGPPTEADIAKLRILRDDYGWTIYPNP